MRFAFIAAEKADFPIDMMCRDLHVSTSGFYAWIRRGQSHHSIVDEELERRISAVHAARRARYGSPRVMHHLRHEGRRVGRARVARLMREQGLFARNHRRFNVTTDSRHDDPIAPNLVARDFTAPAPGVVMVGDTTKVETKEGWLCLAILLDLCTRAIVGWAMSETNDTNLVSGALRMAVRRGARRGFIHHTDRGSTYAAMDCRKLVEKAGGRRSMSRRADCYDNAVAESAFRTIKEEGVEQTMPETISEARERLFSFIEGFLQHEAPSLDNRLPNTQRGRKGDADDYEVGHEVKNRAIYLKTFVHKIRTGPESPVSGLASGAKPQHRTTSVSAARDTTREQSKFRLPVSIVRTNLLCTDSPVAPTGLNPFHEHTCFLPV